MSDLGARARAAWKAWIASSAADGAFSRLREVGIPVDRSEAVDHLSRIDEADAARPGRPTETELERARHAQRLVDQLHRERLNAAAENNPAEIDQLLSRFGYYRDDRGEWQLHRKRLAAETQRQSQHRNRRP